MTQTTKESIARWAQSEWFTNVGRALGTTSVAGVANWADALEISKSKVSKFVRMESINVLTEKLCFEFPDRYHKVWNALVGEIRPLLIPLVESKTAELTRKHNLGKEFATAVRWDILNACMELEYADIVPPRYFAERAKWYLAGHWPCGWQGDFPDGRLMVF